MAPALTDLHCWQRAQPLVQKMPVLPQCFQVAAAGRQQPPHAEPRKEAAWDLRRYFLPVLVRHTSPGPSLGPHEWEGARCPGLTHGGIDRDYFGCWPAVGKGEENNDVTRDSSVKQKRITNRWTYYNYGLSETIFKRLLSSRILKLMMRKINRICDYDLHGSMGP
jgi:hypothetical protein